MKKTLINREKGHGESSDFVHGMTTYLGRKLVLGLLNMGPFKLIF